MVQVTEFWLWRDGEKFQDSWYCFLVDENRKSDGAVVIGVNYSGGNIFGFNERMGLEEARGLHKDLRLNKYIPIDPARKEMDFDELIRQYKLIDNAT